MKTLFMAALMVVMSVTPSLACNGICPMSSQVANQTTSPCPHHSKPVQAKPTTCDGLMLLADCLDLTMAKADTVPPSAVNINWHPNGDTTAAVALMPENTVATLKTARAPPPFENALRSPSTPVYLSTRRLRL